MNKIDVEAQNTVLVFREKGKNLKKENNTLYPPLSWNLIISSFHTSSTYQQHLINFWDILLTSRQIDKQTHKNITFLAGVMTD